MNKKNIIQYLFKVIFLLFSVAHGNSQGVLNVTSIDPSGPINYNCLKSFDIDNDGGNDLIVGMGGINNELSIGCESPIYWFKKLNNNNFERKSFDGINGNICTAIEIVDFDFNGTNDILATIYKQHADNIELFEKRIILIASNLNGVFNLPIDLIFYDSIPAPEFGNPFSDTLICKDVNNDNQLDLIDYHCLYLNMSNNFIAFNLPSGNKILAVTDLNNDSELEIIAQFGVQTISLFEFSEVDSLLNQNIESLSALSNTYFINKILVGYFNSDLSIDILLFENSNVRLFSSDSLGNFNLTISSNLNFGIKDAISIDINNDLFLDLVFYNIWGSEISFYYSFNNGNGEFSTPNLINIEREFRALKSFAVAKDSIESGFKMYATDNAYFNCRLELIEVNLNLNSLITKIIESNSEISNILDFNNDGKIDIVQVENYFDYGILNTSILNSAIGLFSNFKDISTKEILSQFENNMIGGNIIIYDSNSDGREDLLNASLLNDTIYLSSFLQGNDYNFGNSEVISTHFNNYGYVDWIVSSFFELKNETDDQYKYFCITLHRSNYLISKSLVFRLDNFQTTLILEYEDGQGNSYGISKATRIIDLNNDGFVDFLCNGNGLVSIIRGTELNIGVFESNLFSNSDFFWFGLPSRNDFLVHDYDGNNYDDIVITSMQQGKILISYNLGGFEFTEPTIIAENLNLVYSLSESDMNNDGILDILFCSLDSSSSFGYIPNYNNGSFGEVSILLSKLNGFTTANEIHNHSIPNEKEFILENFFQARIDMLRIDYNTVQNKNNVGPTDEIKVYPNPVIDYLYFNGIDNLVKSNLKVFDLMGKEIFNFNLFNNFVNLSLLSKGFYIVSYENNNKTIRKKILKL